jgi:hypothetical protein
MRMLINFFETLSGVINCTKIKTHFNNAQQRTERTRV